MEAAGFSAKLVTSYENTLCYNPKDQNLQNTSGFSTLAMEYMSKKMQVFCVDRFSISVAILWKIGT
jgi:hypothetical protein